jgi:SAM-dependent methyltransferase
MVPRDARVLEIGCGTGELLASLQPSLGVGVDFSGEMIRRAKKRHPRLVFLQCDAHFLCLKGSFDVIILSDVINDLWDVQTAFQEIRRLATPRTRILLNTYSRLWEIPLHAARRLGLAKPLLPQNWLTVEDIQGLMDLSDCEVIRRWGEILCPLPIPLLASFCNKVVVRIWPFHYLALTNFLIARPRPGHMEVSAEPSVSVVVPARNEAGNIPEIFYRLPKMGSRTELIFVEGHSEDGTYEAIEREMERHPEIPCLLVKQVGEGKGDAVRLGFEKARGEILMILDADLTVAPEDLPRFYEVLRSRKGEFVQGVRLVYPMEKEAMRFLNLVGNKFFSWTFTWLLGQSIRDTLCGTKALWRSDYEKIQLNRSYFGDFDPFGDFNLLFGAAKLNLKIVEIPIRYGQRKYGRTNILRWRHGWLLFRTVLFALSRLKFV